MQHAFQELHRPAGSTQKSAALRVLVEGVTSKMPRGGTTDQRAKALWRLIQDEVRRVEFSDERTALTAALHMDSANRGSSIDKRLAFARDRGDFGTQPSGKQHGYDALRHWWGAGVRILGHAVDERLDYLRDHPTEWQEYFNDTVRPTYRRPSKGAQPVFANLFVTTVFMKGRFVHRRITERLMTAQEDNVKYYTARALPEMDDASFSVPVRALWGCRAERIPSRAGEPILTKLVFPTPLRRGEQHYFSSEATANDVDTERRAINVEIDHYGIAPGQRSKTMPTSGLTIRIRFDIAELPDAVWYYADVAERERYDRPEPGDDRWIRVTSLGEAEHTFTDACQPLANYGISIAW
ncbi:hypothetical protein [Actinophytocola sp.]|uniref:hypothetical protein n=1 Tax=Actinophytocola sp. TaxID=1872138 RepID=UPI0025C21071|nr:hypothetical protein [Actinophytocola sp.]